MARGIIIIIIIIIITGKLIKYQDLRSMSAGRGKLWQKIVPVIFGALSTIKK